MIFLFAFLQSIKSIYGSVIFFHLSLKVECFTIGAFELESKFAVAIDLPLGGSAVSRVASNVAAFLGTCEVLKYELNLLFIYHVKAAPS